MDDLWISHITYTFRVGLSYNYPIYIQCANTKVTMTNLTIYSTKAKLNASTPLELKCQQNVNTNKQLTKSTGSKIICIIFTMSLNLII